MTEMPPSTYFVCATPRSGSTLFCETLTATGVAGRPAEYFEALRGTDVPRQPQEYFDLPDAELEALLPRVDWAPSRELAATDNYLDYVGWARELGTTPNGVFAAKLMFGYLGEFVGRLRETGRFDGDDLRVLRAAFPGARFVRVVRLAKVEQAVSLWTAIQTQQWRDRSDGRVLREPVYNRKAISHLVRYLTEHEDQWSTFFARGGMLPHTVFYEELTENWELTLRNTLRFLEIPDADTLELPDPPLQRQAGGRSREWVERYLEEERDTVRAA
jgi:LPS sulfotransferase NodH